MNPAENRVEDRIENRVEHRVDTLVAATNNPHKLAEFIRLFPGWRVLSPAEVGVRFDFAEGGESYLANAFGKAQALHAQVRQPVLADDSGLEVAALDGEPGIYSSRYGATAQGKLSDGERNARLLERVREAPDRACFFVCCMVLFLEPKRFLVAQETLPGVLARAPAGSGGFGFDPVVYIPKAGRTVAELSDAEKDRISHRGRAAQRIRRLLEGLNGPA
jgi:XTP/dITP diphosphohydrolase